MSRKTKKGGGIFNRVKGFFTRKKKNDLPKAPTFLQRVEAKVKGVNKYVTSAPDQYPYREYPFFPGNDRRDVAVDEGELQFLRGMPPVSKVTKSIDRRTMSPATAETPDADKQDMTLPIESLKDGQRRMYLFFYNKMKQHQGEPLSMNTLYASMEEVNDLFHTLKYYRDIHFPIPEKLLTKKEEKELTKEEQGQLIKEREKEYYSSVSDTIALGVFGTPIQQLDLEIQKAESLDHVFPSADNPNQLQFANQYGGYLNRYLPTMLESARKFDYIADKELNYCKAQIGISPRPILENLDSPYCICSFMDSFHLQRYLDEGLPGCSHYILLNKEHFPESRSYDKDKVGASNLPVVTTASKFLNTSFIQDAFKEQGVDTMDEDLLKLIKKEAPELLAKAKVIIATPHHFFDKNDNLVNMYDHFMILSEDALPEDKVISYRDPLKIPAIMVTMQKQNRKFIMCDPYTAYCTKKKRPDLWSQMFGIRTSEEQVKYRNIAFDIYDNLLDTEKFFIDFCQFKRILTQLRYIRQENQGERKKKTLTQKLFEASNMYREPISSNSFTNYMMDITNNPTLFQEFKRLQESIITYDKPVENEQDVELLLSKIRLTPKTLASTSPNVTQALAQLQGWDKSYLQNWRRASVQSARPQASLPTSQEKVPVSLAIAPIPETVIPKPQVEPKMKTVPLWGAPTSSISFRPPKIVPYKPTGAFEEKQFSSANQTRRNLQKRILELETYLNKKGKNYALVSRRRRGNISEAKFMTIKNKVKMGKATANDRQYLKNYELIRNYQDQKLNAERELQGKRKLYDQITSA